MTQKDKRTNIIKVIAEKVQHRRTAQNITPTPGRKPEMSGEAFGEEKVLAISLCATTDGEGAWNDLNDMDMTDLNKLSRHLDKA